MRNATRAAADHMAKNANSKPRLKPPDGGSSEFWQHESVPQAQATGMSIVGPNVRSAVTNRTQKHDQGTSDVGRAGALLTASDAWTPLW